MRAKKTIRFIFVVIFTVGLAASCYSPKYVGCEELKKAAEDKQLMDDTWQKLVAFFDSPLKHNYIVVERGLFLNEEKDYRNMQLNWVDIGLHIYDREITYSYVDGIEYRKVSKLDLSSPDMIKSVYVGSVHARLLFILNKTDIDNLGYDLRVECNNRVMGKSQYILDVNKNWARVSL